MTENKQGYEYEDFVFKCFNAIYAWMNNCPDLKNSFKIEKGVKLPTYNGTTTNQIDIYIEYTQPCGLVVKTAVECKKRKIIEIGQIRDFNDKLRKIKNINGIFAYYGTLQQGVIDYAKEEDIKLWNIWQMIHKIENRILFCLPDKIEISLGIDATFYKDDAKNIANNVQGTKTICIKIEDIEYNFLEDNFKIYDFFNKVGFEKNKIDDKTTTYTKQSDNMFAKTIGIIDYTDVNYIKCKQIIFTVTETEPVETKFTTTIDDSDSLAYIKDIITGKKQIVFESGKIEEKV